MQWGVRREAGGGGEGRGVGVSLVDIAGLHGEEVFLGFFACGSFDALDVVHQASRCLIADVLDRCGNGVIGNDADYTGDAFDDVVDICEVAEHVAVVEHFDGTVVEDSVHEEKR